MVFKSGIENLERSKRKSQKILDVGLEKKEEINNLMIEELYHDLDFRMLSALSNVSYKSYKIPKSLKKNFNAEDLEWKLWMFLLHKDMVLVFIRTL